MKTIASIIILASLIAPAGLTAGEQPVPVTGAVVDLNKPGTIVVEISLGSDDGMKPGDVLVISRKGQRIGKLKVAKMERDRSTATITEVEDGSRIQKGDHISNVEAK